MGIKNKNIYVTNRLSAWALQIFHHASFQDWETYFYVEKRIFNDVISWLLKYQNFDGSFAETKYYPQPLNKRMGIRVSCFLINFTCR